MRRLMVSFGLPESWPENGPSWNAFEAALREFVRGYGHGLEMFILAGGIVHGERSAGVAPKVVDEDVTADQAQKRGRRP